MEMGHFDVDMYAPAPRPPSLTCLLDAPTLTQAYPYALVRVDLTLARDPPPPPQVPYDEAARPAMVDPQPADRMGSAAATDRIVDPLVSELGGQ